VGVCGPATVGRAGTAVPLASWQAGRQAGRRQGGKGGGGEWAPPPPPIPAPRQPCQRLFGGVPLQAAPSWRLWAPSSRCGCPRRSTTSTEPRSFTERRHDAGQLRAARRAARRCVPSSAWASMRGDLVQPPKPWATGPMAPAGGQWDHAPILSLRCHPGLCSRARAPAATRARRAPCNAGAPQLPWRPRPGPTRLPGPPPPSLLTTRAPHSAFSGACRPRNASATPPRERPAHAGPPARPPPRPGSVY